MNNVTLIGRLTKEPEVREVGQGLAVINFTVACDRPVSKEKSKDDNTQTADFVPCVAWRQTADYLGKYGFKGARISVEGSVQTRSYENENGDTVYVTEILANRCSVLDYKDSKQDKAPAKKSYAHR